MSWADRELRAGGTPTPRGPGVQALLRLAVQTWVQVTGSCAGQRWWQVAGGLREGGTKLTGQRARSPAALVSSQPTLSQEKCKQSWAHTYEFLGRKREETSPGADWDQGIEGWGRGDHNQWGTENRRWDPELSCDASFPRVQGPGRQTPTTGRAQPRDLGRPASFWTAGTSVRGPSSPRSGYSQVPTALAGGCSGQGG